MQILSIKKNNTYHPNTLNFKAMKKSQFVGIDRFVVESFKAPIEKFNVWSELQTWAKDLTQEISSKEFLGRSKDTIALRKKIIQEWFDYVTKENDAYTWAMRLLVMAGITQGLKKNENSLPPVLNKGVLADTLTKLEEELISDPKKQFNFNKTYQNNLRAHYTQDSNTGETETKWVVIPSAKHDTKNFKTNIEKLKMLSHKSWCTKSFNAEPYLAKGDFHVFLENGQPKLGVRFVGDEVEEIQGEQNDGEIPIQYYNTVEEHLNEGKYKLSFEAEEELLNAGLKQRRLEMIKYDLDEHIQNKDYEKIFNYFNINATTQPNGKLRIGHYAPLKEDFTWADIGINERELLENVEIIDNSADFSFSAINELKHIKKINGDLILNPRICSLGDLEYIGGNANFINTLITSFDKLKFIGGKAIFTQKSLGSIEEIGGDVSLYYTQDLGKLKKIGGSIRNSLPMTLVSLGELEYIGAHLSLRYTNITSLGKLKYIGGNANFEHSKLDSLGCLEKIGGSVYFRDSNITSLDNLEYIGEDAHFSNSKIESLGKLKKIDSNAFFSNSNITSLGNLEKIKFCADFTDSIVSDLGKLKEIGTYTILEHSKLKKSDFKNVKIGGKWGDKVKQYQQWLGLG